MAHLYPSLHEKFQSEGVCPICLMEMAYLPRFSCASNHVICHRCRPYYYSCPQCLQPLSEIPAPNPVPYDPPPPTHMMPHPPHLAQPYPPSAPEMIHELHNYERHQSNWEPPSPPREEQQLLECPYSHLGCLTKFPPRLRNVHVSRCQYKHHSENESGLCNELENPEQRIPCRYESIGCNVRAPRWRLRNHEPICIYKDRDCRGSNHELVEELGEHLAGVCRLVESAGDPNQMVECRYRSRGCMVRMPQWRRQTHEDKCNYRVGSCTEGMRGPSIPVVMHCPTMDPEEQTDCCWAEYGCRVRPKYERKEIHEAKCNYRMEECCFRGRGCNQLFHPSRRYAHEKSCSYAY